MGVTLAAYLYAGPAAASHVAVTAMFVGQLDRGGSPRQLWHWMAGATVLMAVVSVIASALAAYEISLLLFMGFLAFCAGTSIGINPRAPVVFIYTTAVFAAALIAPAPPGKALYVGLATLIAGGIQTALTALTAPVVGNMPERRAVASALQTLGDELLAVSRDRASAEASINKFASQLTQAESFLRESDISGESRRRLSDVLSTADILSREGKSHFSRGRAQVGRPDDEITTEHFELVGSALHEAAAALQTFKPEANLQELDDLIARLEAISADADSATANNIAASAQYLASSVKAVMDDPKIHRGHRQRSLSLPERIRASISPGSIPFKHGLRMASAAIIGMLIPDFLGLNHGSWVAVTMLMLLRPDAGPALTRFASRTMGNILGATLVVGIAFIIGDHNLLLIAAIGVTSTFLYIVTPVNYTWATLGSSSTAILALTIGGEDPTRLAIERLTDVLIGCVIGVLWAFLFPIWQRTNLPKECANYLTRASKWIKTCSKMAALDPGGRDQLIDKAQWQATKLRAARQSLSALFSTSLVEPPSKQVDIHAISRIMRYMRECDQTMVAAEHMLAHGAPKSKPASREAKAISLEIKQAADLLVNPRPRDTLTSTFDELELNMSETGTLDVVEVENLVAEQKWLDAERKRRKQQKGADQANQLQKKKKKKKKHKTPTDVAVVVHRAATFANRTYRAAENSRTNHETFL